MPEHAREQVDLHLSRGLQFVRPLFEFSGACAGCGETPYLKLLSQLFGDRLQIANATGCSSIYGGNLPSLPWRAGPDGRGPAWSNSLFEDNAEFGFGMRLAVDQQAAMARALVRALADRIGPRLAEEILNAPQRTDSEIVAQRARVDELRRALGDATDGPARDLLALAEYLVRRSLWIVGGDGWAYDIGAGGLDHVLAQNRNVNVMVLDTEVYSNTGGQSSKATPLGASAKFASAGKRIPRKDLALQAIAYGYVYVAQIALGGSPEQTIQALRDAEAYEGPSLDPRIQSLHRPRLRSARWDESAASGGRQRVLAAFPIRSDDAQGRHESLPTRQHAPADCASKRCFTASCASGFSLRRDPKKRGCYCVRRKPRRTRVTDFTRTWRRARERDSIRSGRMKLPPVMTKKGEAAQ